jgi:ferric-dicitrate binding protein FerR (iron transport regulator)
MVTTTSETSIQSQAVEEAAQWLIDVQRGLIRPRGHRNEADNWRADESELYSTCPDDAGWSHICSPKHAAEKFGVPAAAVRKRVARLHHEREAERSLALAAPGVGAGHQETTQS